jgi:hypothetical protein
VYWRSVRKKPIQVEVVLIWPWVTADFALAQAAYTVAVLVQEFPTMRIPAGEVVQRTGMEKQVTTLTVSIASGCKVVM